MVNIFSRIALIGIAMLGLAGTAVADGGHHRHFHSSFGIYIGDPFWPWYYRPYYYYPPVITVPAAPPVYIEQGAAAEAPGSQGAYWYYCDRSQAYYPYVKDCPGGWKRVVPTPPPS